jgi:hypothetical protein
MVAEDLPTITSSQKKAKKKGPEGPFPGEEPI